MHSSAVSVLQFMFSSQFPPPSTKQWQEHDPILYFHPVNAANCETFLHSNTHTLENNIPFKIIAVHKADHITNSHLSSCVNIIISSKWIPFL